MENYFNTLSLRDKLSQLGKCRFMSKDEFKDGADLLKNWNIVIIGCGAQGLNPRLEHERFRIKHIIRLARASH